MIVYATSGKTVNMRTLPNTSSLIIQAIPIGTEVEILENGNTWSKIKYLEMEGYMMSKFLRESSISRADLQCIYDSLAATLKTIEEVLK